jgi:DNA polymerase III subunit delta'
MSVTRRSGKNQAGLDGVAGQARLVARLRQLLEDGVPGHAYCFSGAEGMGKHTIAHAFAAHWICTGPLPAPCGRCRSCTTFAAGSHPDVVMIRPVDGKIPIDAIRSMQEAFSTRPLFGRRLCLLEDAEKMNEPAQNCLLKTLEEPPANTLILMTSSGYDSLQATIRSRVAKLPLDGYGTAELKEILRKSSDATVTDFLLAFSMGIPGRAMSLMLSRTLEPNRQRVAAVMTQGRNPMEASGMESLWRHLAENKPEFAEIADLLQGLLRDLLAAREGVEGRLINADKTDTIRRAARLRTRGDWMAAMDRVDDIRLGVRNNLNYQIAVDALNAALGPLFDG